ncbi:hypothetical protein [Amycolatopsis rubida]|uniref:Uncharacterized protein n=1 Tax=Amycolatopsis rubida TaxID=112413 RepID=A0A1I5EMX3_9PSEU|nr:hypothetical protein [Amycolatopsis rubida]SFO12683.1 hypothetical protein SAMN05421854_101712 [Amycolatopsis rubida]
MTDPFQFSKKNLLDEHQVVEVRAPDDAVATWFELAGLACAELRRMGVPASVEAPDEPLALESPPGARIHVADRYPYGVLFSWNSPIVDSESFQAKLIAQKVDDPLVVRVFEVARMMERAVHRLLDKAGFRVLIDNSAHMNYEYRILAAPARLRGTKSV